MVEAPPQALTPANAPVGDLTARRLRAEWARLCDLVHLNPGRLANPSAVDTTFSVTLTNTPALPLTASAAVADSEADLPWPEPVRTHPLRIVFPRFFPTVPMELYLEHPMRHPNIHPVTGFVCLWEAHRVSYTLEHALHRAAAILGWRLLNPDPRHVMQPGLQAPQGMPALLQAPVLRGLDHSASLLPPTSKLRRRRLS